YLGVNYWPADAPSGVIDNLIVYDRALTSGEIEFPTYTFPYSTVIGDIDLSAVPGGSDIVWSSDNEAVISASGKVTRQNEDCVVTLTGTLGDITREFKFTVLKNQNHVNDDVVLSYDFSGSDTSVVIDRSGNGNHGVIHGGMINGYFDGADDYVEMPEGILNGYDELTIVLRLTPEIALTNYFTFCFGNSSDSGYFFLNTSRPSTNTIRLAITDKSYGEEKSIRSLPGLRYGEYASVVITAKGSYYKMYIDGLPVAAGDMGMSISDLGNTSMNYLAKSPYSGDAYFKGTIEEFSVYTNIMDESEIYAKYYVPESDESYFRSVSLDSSLSAELARDCIVAASFYDADGNLIYATTKKVSEDDLTVEFDAKSAVSAEVAAFDAATGIVKDKLIIDSSRHIVAYKVSGGCIKINNSSDDDVNVAVIDACYDGNALSGVDITTVTVGANSFEVVPVSDEDGHRAFVWTSIEKMIPVSEK
ncbi:MAG: LamG-like jellyroll fold domain-containing protein, partial [Clostridia bacterium]